MTIPDPVDWTVRDKPLGAPAAPTVPGRRRGMPTRWAIVLSLGIVVVLLSGYVAAKLGSRDGAGDVRVVKCYGEAVSDYGWRSADLVVTNSGSREATYRITVEFSTFAGKRLDSGAATATDLRPGEAVAVTARAIVRQPGRPEDFHCQVTKEVRT